LTPDQARIQRDIESFSRIIDHNEIGYTRRFFSEAYLQATHHAARLMEAEGGLSVKRDAAGNLIGRREGTRRGTAPIMIGSHLDTVRGGGRFDGVAGVVAGLEVARMLIGGTRFRAEKPGRQPARKNPFSFPG
jgi:N-carbamoyl-L-amino-acid hydrolase